MEEKKPASGEDPGTDKKSDAGKRCALCRRLADLPKTPKPFEILFRKESGEESHTVYVCMPCACKMHGAVEDLINSGAIALSKRPSATGKTNIIVPSLGVPRNLIDPKKN